MGSGAERPDLEALRELEEVLRHLEDELASWRRRALSSEARLAERVRALAEDEDVGIVERMEAENRRLSQRLEQARERVAGLVDRLKFLEQQSGNGASGGERG
jgi:hypothetical protein